MESHETAAAAWKPHAGRYASALVVTVPVSLTLFAVFIALKCLCPALRDASAVALWLSLAGGYFVAPVLGLLTVAAMRAEGSLMARRCAQPAGGERVPGIASRLLLAGFLLVPLSSLPVVCLGVYGLPYGLLPTWLAAWLILTALTACALGCFAFKLARVCGRRFLHAGAVVVAALGLVAAIALSSTTNLGSCLVQRVVYAHRGATFSGDSASLKRTAVIPTLDGPGPLNRNVIWCSSFQLGWNELKDNVIGGSLEVAGAQEVAARLNAAPQSGSDLEPRSFYAAAGRTRDGIVNQVESDMAARFPAHVLPDLGAYGDGILAYSYLAAQVPFKYPFRQLVKGLTFTDSGGAQTQVAGFGLWEAHRPPYAKIREQVEILYTKDLGREYHYQLEEYALDLCKHSEPYQVVVAMVAPKGSLAETLEYLRLGMKEFQHRTDFETARDLQKQDRVEVPEMFWEIDHRFHELIGRMVDNVGLPIVEARQTIAFRLDRFGATLESESLTMLAATPRRFVFNRPFLVYMQKRGAEHPFFVMWVDNAELFTRK